MTHGPALLVRAALVIVLATAAIGTPADADLWGHLTFGRDIVAAREVHRTDPYSFTSDRSWINHEWLSEVVFAVVYDRAGSPGLIAFKVAIIAALLVLVWRVAGRVQPAAPASIRWGLVALTFAGTYWRTHNVRPQLFSVLLFATVLAAILDYDAGRRRTLFALPALMVVWVNLHGGWIVGLAVLLLWLLTRAINRDRTRSERAALAAIALASIAATLVNPYDLRLWAFLAETVRFGRADIEEWSHVFSDPARLGVPWALTAAAGVLALVTARGQSPLDRARVVIVGGLAIASLRVSRLDAFFTLAVVLLFAPLFASLRVRAGHAPPLRVAVVTGGARRLAAAISVAAIGAMLIPAARIAQPLLTCLPVSGEWSPDDEAGRFMVRHRLGGRLLTWFDWGEDAIWHFGPAVQVSIDGRRETVYSDRVIQTHRRFYAAEQNPAQLLSELAPDYIWLPQRVPVVAQLPALGWIPLVQTPRSTLFARTGARQPEARQPEPGPAPPDASAMRCFPGL